MRPFIGSEALAAGGLTRHRLAAQYTAVFRDVYFPRGHLVSPVEKAVAAWLWSRRTATVVGLSAAALHGAKCIDRDAPAELVHTSRHRTPGISLRSDTVRAVAALVDRHRGARGLVRLRQLLSTADGGLESPQETRVRLLLADSGLPRPSTQIHVFDQYGCFIARPNSKRWAGRSCGSAPTCCATARAPSSAECGRQCTPPGGECEGVQAKGPHAPA